MKQTCNLLLSESAETRVQRVSSMKKHGNKKSACVIPESEVWLYKNKAALQAVENGLRQMANGEEGEYLGSFKSFLNEESEKTQIHEPGKRKPQGVRARHSKKGDSQPSS